MTDNEIKQLSEVIGKQVGQTHLVTRCVIRALVQQPGFDAGKFLHDLKEEDIKMTDAADGAKDVIQQIVSEVEGYV
jgi:hypothetical protein